MMDLETYLKNHHPSILEEYERSKRANCPPKAGSEVITLTNDFYGGKGATKYVLDVIGKGDEGIIIIEDECSVDDICIKEWWKYIKIVEEVE